MHSNKATSTNDKHPLSSDRLWANDLFIEAMKKKTRCRLYYRVVGDNNIALLKEVEAPILDVVPSSFDWSWYPSAYAEPYTAYCSLSSEEKLNTLFPVRFHNETRTLLPYAVSLSNGGQRIQDPTQYDGK
jgi:hypothetical protein